VVTLCAKYRFRQLTYTDLINPYDSVVRLVVLLFPFYWENWVKGRRSNIQSHHERRWWSQDRDLSPALPAEWIPICRLNSSSISNLGCRTSLPKRPPWIIKFSTFQMEWRICSHVPAASTLDFNWLTHLLSCDENAVISSIPFNAASPHLMSFSSHVLPVRRL